jgi:hypothetical protein
MDTPLARPKYNADRQTVTLSNRIDARFDNEHDVTMVLDQTPYPSDPLERIEAQCHRWAVYT